MKHCNASNQTRHHVGVKKNAPAWERPAPKHARHHKMTPGEERRAEAIARKHGTKVGLADRLAAMK